MVSIPRVLFVTRVLAVALAAAGCMGFVNLSLTPAWVKNALSLGREDQLHATPTVARFSDDEGGGFILDRSHHPALLKFEDSAEVWVVSASRGPRGDIIFKDDTGDTLLRITKLGGVTVVAPRWPMGLAATLEGSTGALRPTAIGPDALYERMILASSRCSRVARHLVPFDAPDADAKSAAIIADAALSAMNAVLGIAAKPSGKAILAHLTRVIFTAGPAPAASLRHGTLVITVNPNSGLSGHPSSARIAQALEGS